MSIHSCHFWFKHVQFTLIHGSNILVLCNIVLYSIGLPLPVPSTTGCCFCFGSIYSFFLELFLHSSPVAYWASTNLGSSSFSVIYFCLFILFMGFSRQEYWNGFPFPCLVDYFLSEFSTMTHLSWVSLHGVAHKLDRAAVHVISLISFLRLWFSFCMPSEG